MKRVLVVIDMQNDFIDGALGTQEAVSIVDNVKRIIDGFEGDIYFTRDTHGTDYHNTQEGKKLPIVHCVKNTAGWKITDKLNVTKARYIIDKPTFGSTELAEIIKKEANGISEIILIGLCTDICVISNAMLLKAALPEILITVDASACAGVTPKSHKTALNAMKQCQINIINEKNKER